MSKEWAERKRLVAERTSICQRCGWQGATEVHHLTYERRGAEWLEDLQYLCRDCHALVGGYSQFDPCEISEGSMVLVCELLIDTQALRKICDYAVHYHEKTNWYQLQSCNLILAAHSREAMVVMGKALLSHGLKCQYVRHPSGYPSWFELVDKKPDVVKSYVTKYAKVFGENTDLFLLSSEIR